MAKVIDFDTLLAGCADDSFDDGIRIDTETVPLTGPSGPVKPAGRASARWHLGTRAPLPARSRWATLGGSIEASIPVMASLPSPP